MKLKWESWLYSMWKSVVGGVAATAGAYLGTLVGNQISKEIPVMNWQSLGFIVAFSAISNLFFYLQKAPAPEDEEATPPTKLPLILLGVWLAGAGLLSPALLTGCATAPAARAVQISDSAQVTVEAALRAWDAYIVAHHPPLSQQRAVKDAWLKYQAAQLLVLDTAVILREAQTAGTNESTARAALNSAIANAGMTLADLLGLIRQFGGKI